MKRKLTLLSFILLFIVLGVAHTSVFAQTVIVVANNASCPDEGKITATASEFSGTVGYQLKTNNTVVRPLGGSGYQNSNLFENLPAGTYIVLADDGTTSVESAPVTIAINYTPITASVAPGTVTCGNATTSLTVAATGGSSNFLYAITPASETNAPPAASFQSSPTFLNLAVGSYKFWVKDNACASATLVNTTGAVNSVLAPNAADYGLPSLTGKLAFATANNHLSGYRVSLERFVRGQLPMTAADAASFTVQIYNGGTAIAGPVQVPAGGAMNIPVPSGLVGATLTAVLKNTCNGTTKIFSIIVQGPEMTALATCPGPQAMYRLMNTSLVSLPATITYTNQDGTGNGNQTILRTVANNEYIYVNFPPNSIFDWKVVDASGTEWSGVHNFTTDLISAPTQWTSYIDNCTPNRGTIELVVRGIRNSTPLSYQILSAPAGSESLIGYIGTTYPGWKNDYTLLLNGQTYFPRGTYRIKFIDAGCHNGREMNVTAQGRVADVPVASAVQTTANCGSFNFKLNGTYDASFQQFIVSGPTGTAGLVRSNTQSFTNMPYGTYKVALRVAGVSCNLFEREFTYSAESSIDFDAINSGGFTCTAGGTGNLFIAASTTIQGAVLEYSINNGQTWQTSNIFPNLNEGNYNVVIKENGCGNQRTVSVSVLSNIQATINNQPVATTLCEGSNTILNINAIGGTKYTWTYPDGSIHVRKIQNLNNISPANAGVYSVVVEAGSCVTPPQSVSLKVVTKPTVDVIAAQQACNAVVKTINFNGVPAREYLSASSSTDLTTTYTWTNDNSATGLPLTGYGNISFTPTNTGNTPIVSNITVIAQGLSGCATNAVTFTITIAPDSKLTLTSATSTNAQEKCINEAITDIIYTVTNATSATVTGLPAGLTGVYNAGIYTISGTATEVGTFNYTVTATGSCANAVATGTVKINPGVELTLTSVASTTAQSVNINTTITDITYALSEGSTGVNVTGLPSGVTGNLNAGVFKISGTPTITGAFNYTIESIGGCGSAKTSGQIIVNADAGIVLTSASGTDRQTLCINTPIASIEYAITNGTNATVVGLPAGLSGVYTIGNFKINGTPTISGVFTYTITVTGAGSPITATGTINVTPNTSIALSSANGTDAQTKCVSTAITNITYAVTNGTGATVTGLPAGVTGSYASGVFTISGTPTVSGRFNYTVTATGVCASTTAIGTINVTPNTTIALTSATGSNAQTKCVSNAITNITYAVTNGTAATVTGLPAGVTGNYAAGVFTISGTPTVSGSFNYTVTATGACAGATATGTINVTPNTTVALSSANGTGAQTKCVSTSITNITYAVTNGTGATVTGLPAGVTGSYASGVFTISGTPTVSGSFNYTVTATGACASTMATGTINVTPNTTIALTSATGSNAQTKCVSNAITNITYAVTNGTGATVTGLPAGVTGNYAAGVFTISGTPTVSGTFNYTVTATGACASTTATGTINVTPNTTIALSSANGTDAQTKCVSTAISNITYAVTNGTGATVTGLPNGINGVYNNGIFTISGTSKIVGTFNYVITATGTCQSAMASGTIIINPLPAITVTSDLGLSISKGDVATLTATGGSTYSWSPSTDVQSGQATSTLKVRPRQTTTYTVTVTHASGCSDVMPITITVTDDYKLIPNNVITPNGDGKNDTWVIKNIDYYPNNTVKIFDRAGRLVYTKKGYNNEWDGTFNGNYLNEDAYIFVIDMGTGIGLVRGTVSIIRDSKF